MNRDLIYQIRENKNLYLFLKYNSYLYKQILRNEITVKELEKIMKEKTNQTGADKLRNISRKIELANTLLNILK